MNFVYLIASISICLTAMVGKSLAEDTQMETSWAPDVSADKETICEATKTADADMKIDVNGFMEYDDLLRLIVWNSKYDLKSGNKKFAFPAEVNWKRTILDRLTKIFLKSCPAEYVNPGFINVATELFMIYQNSLNGTVDHSKLWKPFLPVLDKCLDNAVPLEIVGTAFAATGVKITTKKGEKEDVLILPPLETADEEVFDIDTIVDTIWWLFSFSFGTCYWRSDAPSIWSSRYKRLFFGDFLMQLRERWLNAGAEVDFGVIFGDFNLNLNLHNMRVCVTSAYTINGLADRQLVRSVPVGPPGSGVQAVLNKKTSGHI
ncbi:hypothetical protein Ocin01_13959 [Orchesella cincta]|uniref:Uncharacterized protein n=1 Tax=Orchesella cincta TaxID=48709 RepID=A0A1D2MIU1_ORCCI|nr:hypothetical protein Ocin01_13959 [Orchesella cincta]